MRPVPVGKSGDKGVAVKGPRTAVPSTGPLCRLCSSSAAGLPRPERAPVNDAQTISNASRRRVVESLSGARSWLVDRQHQLPSGMAGHSTFERLSGYCQRDRLCDHRANCASIDQRRDLAQLFAIGSDDEEHAALAVLAVRCCFGFGDRLRQTDQDSSRLQHLPGSFARTTTDGVKNDIRIAHGLFEPNALIVNDLIRPKVEQEVAVLSRRGADHVRTLPAGNLNRKGANPSGGAVDQHTLARRKSRVLEKGLPGSKRRKRDGGRLHKIKCLG